MSMVKESVRNRDSKTLKLSEEELLNVNNIVTSLTSYVLRHLHQKTTESETGKETSSVPRNQWIRMLLLNLFDACAMSYRASSGKFMKKLSIANRKISGQPCEGFYTGSIVEGVGCASSGEYSDTDIMNVLKNFKAIYQNEGEEGDIEGRPVKETEQRTSAGSSNSSGKATSVIRLLEGSYPGYTKLMKCETTNTLIKITSTLNYGPVIRSSKAEHLLAHEFEYDDAIAVQCENWPKEALSWLSRRRPSGWPSKNLVEECARVPCYIVSKAHAGNMEDEYEWRFSFARQEGILFRNMPLKVKMVYILSKFLVKSLQIADSSLSTYQMKTMFLWHCEQKSDKEFHSLELETNIEEFLVFLARNLDEHRVQNYFIPANNMISHISKDIVKDVKQKVESILPDFMTLCSSIETAKTYPFSVRCISAGLKSGSEAESVLINRIQSNFLHVIAENILSSYLPLSTCMWMYTSYVPRLNSSCPTSQEQSVQLLGLIQLLQKHSPMVFGVYGLPFVKLAILYFVLQLESSPDMLPVFIKLLPSIFGFIKDVDVSYSLADVFCFLGMEKGLTATKNCCYLISEWAHQNKTGGDIMMHTLQQVMTVVGMIESRKHCKMLLSRLNEMSILLDVSPSQIEVGLATTLRLNQGTSTVETLETFCSLRFDISLDGAQKQLVYATFLFLDESESSVPHEAENSLSCSKALFDSKIYTSAATTFSFVTSVVIYQKLTNGQRRTVQKFLHLLQTSGTCSKIKELQSDIEDLLSTPELDPGTTFQFVLYYTRLCMRSTSTGFVLSVLDELVPPHINLGILSGSGIELTSTTDIDLSIDCLETWIHRSTEANVVQNKALPVKVYGKLGHLYHVKCQSTEEKDQIRKYRNKANVCFQTALKEDVIDISVIGDYRLFCKTDLEEFKCFVDHACFSNDVCQISAYFSSSIPALSDFRELQREIEINGNIQLCSAVFVRYLASEADGYLTECSKDQVRQMKKVIEQLTEILYKQQETQTDVEMQKSVLSDSLRILCYCAAKAEMNEEVAYALSQAQSMSPGRCTSDTFTALSEKLEADSEFMREEKIYSRI